ncbi:MAG: hypothetical protein M3277_08695 [Actinomycetota bacterium]|nr:hypothetical protein [Actinomycetota bacterium]
MKTKLVLLVAAALILGAFLVAPAKAGGGPHCEPQITDARTNVVTLAKNCFSPTIARVDVGNEVTFVSKDPVPHTITGALFVFGDMDEVMQGDERQFTFEEEGIYPYVCILHPGMVGAIVIGDGVGPGGVVSETTTYQANPAEEGTATDGETAPTSARDDSISWSVVPAALVALVTLAFVSIGLPKRVRAGVALTTKP